MKKRTLWRTLPFLLLAIGFAALGSTRFQPVAAQEEGPLTPEDAAARAAYMQRFAADQQAPMALAPMSATPCVGGMAGIYPCENVDLLAFLPLASIGGGSGNDSWGWTDPLDGKEYALMGRTSGTSFVDISDPENPLYLGNLPTQTNNSTWRDIKVYNNYAFIVSEASGHGMQVFDLTRLRNVPVPPVTFTVDAHYSGFGNAHNIAIDEDTGFAYAVGTSTCSGGLHMIDIQNPLNPTNAGCFSSDGYTHDTQCVVYAGPDVAHQGQEICFNSNEDTLTIVDVTNHAAPVQLSRTSYSGSGYTHQGWLTEDHQYFLLDDELDEQNFGHNTRTRIWDVSDLEAPLLTGFFDAPVPAIDHNLYTKGNYVYEANYRSGLRILDSSAIGSATLTQEGYFDIYPSSDSANFNGAWNTYPYYESGVVIISGIEQGLFIVRPTSLVPDFSLAAEPETLDVCVPANAEFTATLGASQGFSQQVTLSSVGHPAGTTATFTPNPVTPPGSTALTIGNTGGATPGSYSIDIVGTAPTVTHTATVMLNLAAGVPGAPTLASPANNATNIPINPTFQWNAAANASGYFLEVATDSGFTNVVYSATTSATSHTVANGSPLNFETQYYWRVTAQNGCGTGSASATFRFTTTSVPPVFCAAPNLAIPDNNPAGATANLTYPNSGTILDLNVSLDVTHTWVGDILFTVSHNGTSVTIFDRPGVPGSTFGCSGNDIAATLDDEAALPVESQCGAGTPTISGTFSPNNPLSAFDGMDISGLWTITAVDLAGSDTGTLDEWCLVSTLEIPLAYGVALSANQGSTAPAGTTVTYILSITNTGDLTDTYGLTISGETWTTTLSTPSVTLDPGESTAFDAWVQIPPSAANNAQDTATLTATSQGDPGATAETGLTTTAELVPMAGVALSPDQAGSGQPGMTVTYTLRVTNTGNIPDSFTLAVSGTWTTTLSLTQTGTLAPGASATFTLTGEVPAGASGGEADVAIVSAASAFDGTSAEAQVTTTAEAAPAKRFWAYIATILR